MPEGDNTRLMSSVSYDVLDLRLLLAFSSAHSNTLGNSDMALLMMNMMTGQPDEWTAAIKSELPDMDVRFVPDVGAPEDIHYLAFGRPVFDDLPELPNLKFMLTRQAGVDGWINHPKRPQVAITKLEPESGDPMMSEYVVMHVLRLHRNMIDYENQQTQKIWKPLDQHRPEDRRIGFLGFGTMAKTPANILVQLGFDLASWTRSPKDADGVTNFHGQEQFEAFMNRTDIAVCLLPLTADTKGIFRAETLAMMPKGAMIINIGRGEHVVDEDLISAIDSGHISAAALDTTSPEPLPEESPLWSHPRITVLPHVARRPNIAQMAPQIVANIKRFEAGESLLQEINVAAGY